MRKAAILTLAAAAAIGAAGNASAGVLYSSAGSVYSQDFNGLPHEMNNGKNIQYNNVALISNGNAPFPGGWKDDTAFDNTNLGIKGWYLWHNPSLAQGGVTGHAQVRYGNGAGTSGAFYVYTSGIVTSFATTPWTTNGDLTEKALGILSTNGINGTPAGRAYIGLQLINDTGQTLDSFTITYDGEQYRDNGVAGTRDGFDLQWSLSATATGWMNSDSVSPVPGDFYYGVNGVERGAFAFDDPDVTKRAFLTPKDGSAAGLDGNLAENRVADITHTVTGINWAPGAQLWVRWRDQFQADGVAIDNVSFTATAVPEPGSLALVALAVLCGGCRQSRRRE